MALSFSGPETVEATVKSGAIDLQSVRASYPGLFTPLKGLSLKGKGKTRTSVKATFKEGSPAHLALETDLRFKGGGFSTADGTTVAEGINMDLSGILEIPDPTAGAIFSIDAQATGFELLSGRFYGDFKEKKASLLLEGRYLKDGDTLNISRADLRLTGMGRLSLSGHVSGLTSTPGFDADVHLSDLSNRDVYGFFIRDTFKESFPILSSLQLDGVSELALSVKGSRQGFEARGNLKVLDAGLTSRDGELAVRGGAIFLPVDVSYPRATSHKEVERFGSLRFKNITWRSLKIQDFQAFPVLWGDSLHFREDVKIPLFGGSVTFKNITFSHLFSPSRKLLFATDLDDLDLEKLSSGLGIHRFRGSLSGTIPKASFSGSSVVTEGEIVIKLFGGEMRIKEISVRNVFSPVASFKSSIELKEIHLARLTETFEFGHISGILEGYVNDLVITDGQPESFEASIETVKRRGVKQRISVKALEKISILGTGSSATVLGRGIYSLFKEYNYSKMGFSGRLRNDTFLLKGIEREGDTGYLVRGGLFPPKVNVIYYTQEVSFREMVKRLKRITLAGEKEEVKTR